MSKICSLIVTVALVLPAATAQTPRLHQAACNGDQTAVERLIAAGAEVNARHPNTGSTALMLAAEKGRDQIVSVLLRANADFNLRANNGLTALIETSGADIDVQNKDGRTALYRASELGNVHAKAKDGTSALTMASELGHRRVVRILQAAGAK